VEKNITVQDILEATKGNLMYGNKNEICEKFSKSTKEIQPGDVYIGFKGERFDGGMFYEDALKQGAKGCIINKIADIEIKNIPNKFVIQVDDTVEAIAQIAKLKREKYNIPVIAVTGSVGKTSTKDIIYSVVSQKYKTLKTQGNMNNHIGMPMTILGLEKHEALVIEMGMNHFGELRKLTQIAKPTIAVITNVGTAHIGNLGSRENILKAKLEILEGLQENGSVVINNDNDLLNKWQAENKKYKVITYGINNKSTNIAQNITYNDNGSKYELYPEKQIIAVPVGGEAFVYNSLAAINVATKLGCSVDSIKEALLEVRVPGRSELVNNSKELTIMIDYAHSPESLENILNAVKSYTRGRVISVFGCGGDRDTAKRSIMGEISGRIADFTIITSDNPRTEEPQSIIDEIETGIKKTKGKYECIVDRIEAIKYAINMASKKDIIVLAGKGHEPYQEINGVKHPFDERIIVNQIIKGEI